MEITDRFVEIALDCENGGLWYRVITYYKDGTTNTDSRFIGDVKERLGEVLDILGGSDLEFLIEDALVY